jgi:hypothetical protein
MPLTANLEPVSETYRLCYVQAPWAWFTRLPLSHQWGDGWERAPYQREAGPPYDDTPGTIVRLAFDGPFIAPQDDPRAPPLSVNDINHGQAPWLRSEHYEHSAPLAIMGGTTLERFVEIVQCGGGSVFAPLGWRLPQPVDAPSFDAL